MATGLAEGGALGFSLGKWLVPSSSACPQFWAHHLHCTMAYAALPDLVTDKLTTVSSTYIIP